MNRIQQHKTDKKQKLMTEDEKQFFNNYQRESDNVVAVNTFVYLVRENYIKLSNKVPQQVELSLQSIQQIINEIESNGAEKLTQNRFQFDKVTEHFISDADICVDVMSEPIITLSLIEGGKVSNVSINSTSTE